MLLCQVGQRAKRLLTNRGDSQGSLCIVPRLDGMASEVTGFEGRVASKGWRPGSASRVVLNNAGR